MPDPAAELEWIRPPLQERTAAVLARLLDTAERLLDEKSFDDLSVADLARAAETSVGGFYRRFRDKRGLLHALHERFVREARATADDALDPARWQGRRLVEIVPVIVRFLTGVLSERQGLDRAVLAAAVTDGDFELRQSQLSRYVSEKLSALLLEHRAEITHPEPEVAVDVSIRQVLGVLLGRFAVRPQETELVPLSDERISAEMSRSILSYLGVLAPQDFQPPTDSN